MESLLVAASTALALALVLFTLGVFSERHQGRLRARHAVLFWCGLASNIAGILILGHAWSEPGRGVPSPMHLVISFITIGIAAFQAVWATTALAFRRLESQRLFHQLNVLIWLLWLIPYPAGAFMDLPGIHLEGIPSFALSTMLVLVLAALLHPTHLHDQEQNA